VTGKRGGRRKKLLNDFKETEDTVNYKMKH